MQRPPKAVAWAPGDPRTGVERGTARTRADGRWAWQLTADNGQVIATYGSQGYENQSDAQRMGDQVISGTYAGRTRLRRGCAVATGGS